MVTIDPIRVEVELEDDGSILASVPDLPGVIGYVANIVDGEEVPEPLRELFAA